jgi:hypothetical protein
MLVSWIERREAGVQVTAAGHQTLEKFVVVPSIASSSVHDAPNWERFLLQRRLLRRLAVKTSRHGTEYIRSTIALSLSADGTRLASTHGDHVVRVYTVQQGGFWNISLPDTGAREVIGDTWGQFTVNLLYELHGHPRTPWSVRFHPHNADLLVSGCLGGHCYVWHRDRCIARYIVSEQHPEHFAFFPDYGPTSVSCVAFDPSGDVIVIAARRSLFFWEWREAQRRLYRMASGNSQVEMGSVAGVEGGRASLPFPEAARGFYRRQQPTPSTADSRATTTGPRVARRITVQELEQGYRDLGSAHPGTANSVDISSPDRHRRRARVASSRRWLRNASRARLNSRQSEQESLPFDTGSPDSLPGSDTQASLRGFVPFNQRVPTATRSDDAARSSTGVDQARAVGNINQTSTHGTSVLEHHEPLQSACYFLGMPVHLVDVPLNAGLLVVGTRSPILPAEQEAELFRAAAAPFTLDIQLYRLSSATTTSSASQALGDGNTNTTGTVHLGALIGKIPQVVAYNEAGISVSADGRHILVCIVHGPGSGGASSAATREEEVSTNRERPTLRHQGHNDSTQHGRSPSYVARVVIYEIMMAPMGSAQSSNAAERASFSQTDEGEAFPYFELRERASMPLEATRARALTNLRFVSPLVETGSTDLHPSDRLCFLAGYSFRESMTHFRALRDVEPRPLIDLFEADLHRGVVQCLRTIPQDAVGAPSVPNATTNGLDFRAFAEVDGVNCALFLPMPGADCTHLVQGILYGTQRGELYALVH